MDAARNVTAAQDFLVVVYADFVCPYSYLAVDQVDRLVDEYGVRAFWRPHWLHPEVPPEGMPYAQLPAVGDRREALDAWLQEMAPAQHARMRFPAKLQYSLHAFEALEFAADANRSMPFKSAVFCALWEEGADIGQAGTLQRAAEKAGLDAEALGRALAQRRYAARALRALAEAHSLGVSATPTLFVGRTRINGWHYYEVLQSVMERQGMSPRTALAERPAGRRA